MKYSMLLILLFTNLCISAQDYLGISKSQLIAVKGTGLNEDVKNNTLIYETPALYGSEPGVEIFYLDDSDLVVGFLFFKNVYKKELLELIKYNNLHYQSRNSGVKGQIQWIDPQNKVEFSLKTSEWTDNISVIYYKVFSVH